MSLVSLVPQEAVASLLFYFSWRRGSCRVFCWSACIPDCWMLSQCPCSQPTQRHPYKQKDALVHKRGSGKAQEKHFAALSLFSGKLLKHRKHGKLQETIPRSQPGKSLASTARQHNIVIKSTKIWFSGFVFQLPQDHKALGKIANVFLCLSFLTMKVMIITVLVS